MDDIIIRLEETNNLSVVTDDGDDLSIDTKDTISVLEPRYHNELRGLDYEEAGHTGFMPSKLSLLDDIDASVSNDRISLLASVEGTPSKITVQELQARIIRTVDEVPDDLQEGQYLFKKIEER